jgi:hypothetical protein
LRERRREGMKIKEERRIGLRKKKKIKRRGSFYRKGKLVDHVDR